MTKPRDNTLLTIGLPVYNGEAYIAEAIKSLLSQSYSDFRLVISDNNSSDSTVEICREFCQKDHRLSLITQENNLGATGNFLFLLESSKTELFMWAAADDWWHPSFLKRCVDRIAADPTIMYAMSGYRCVSRRSRLLKLEFPKLLHFIEKESAEERLDSYGKLSYSTHKDNLVYSVWRRDFLLEAVEQFRKNTNLFTIGGEMNEYILALGRGAFIDATLFHKKYRTIPPGHWLEGSFRIIKKLSEVGSR